MECQLQPFLRHFGHILHDSQCNSGQWQQIHHPRGNRCALKKTAIPHIDRFIQTDFMGKVDVGITHSCCHQQQHHPNQAAGFHPFFIRQGSE
jgi:hypothetical protein